MDHAVDAAHMDLKTITRYVLNEQSQHPESRGDFTILLSYIVLACICSAVNKAGLAKLIGLAGETNVQGEEQKKLDVLSNEASIKALVSSSRTCILVSEEDEEATFVEPSKRAENSKRRAKVKGVNQQESAKEAPKKYRFHPVNIPHFHQAVLRGGETKITPSPLTKRKGTIRFVV